jgi:hypothetical protein
MSDFLFKLASFDPTYAANTDRKTKLYLASCGVVLLLLTVSSFASYTFVGYMLTGNFAEAVVVGFIFSFFLFIFYRLALLNSNRIDHATLSIKKINYVSTTVKLTFMSLNLLFFVYAFEIMLFNETLAEYIIQNQAKDGIINRINLLNKQVRGAGLITFLLWLFFIFPIVVRYLLKAWSIQYDEAKTKFEASKIRNSFSAFQLDYESIIKRHTANKASDIIYKKMIDPPFNCKLQGNSLPVGNEEDLFSYLENKLNKI